MAKDTEFYVQGCNFQNLLSKKTLGCEPVRVCIGMMFSWRKGGEQNWGLTKSHQGRL